MEFTAEDRGRVKVFHLRGKIMGDPNTEVMCEYLKDLIIFGAKYLVMDFREVEWINSSGIGKIISCLTTLRQTGGDLRFANLHHMAQHYFHITKLESVVRSFNSVENAVASFEMSEARV
jgi:anti-sigma B factor antagonist